MTVTMLAYAGRADLALAGTLLAGVVLLVRSGARGCRR